MGILNKYKQTLLENRVKRLEQAVNEKSVGRGHQDRIHFTIWKFLRDNGPKTKEEIQSEVGSSIRVLPEMERENCVFKNGDLYSFNPDYMWDDIGVVPPTPEQIRALLAQNGSDPESDVEDSLPVEPSQAPRQRQPRQRAVKANIFSKKYDEVKAAIDQGQDVNQVDPSGRSAVGRACMSDGPDAARIVQLLLENGADPNSISKGGNNCIFVAMDAGNIDMIRALIEAGIDTKLRSKKDHFTPFQYAVYHEIFNRNVLLPLIDENFKSVISSRGAKNLLTDLSMVFRRGKISNALYTEVLNKIYDNVKDSYEVRDIFDNYYIAADVKKGSTAALVICTNENWLPVSDAKALDNETAKVYLNAAKSLDYTNYKYDLSYAIDFIIELSEKLGESPDWIWDSIDVKSIVDSNDRDHRDVLMGVVDRAIKYNNIDLLNKVAKALNASQAKNLLSVGELIYAVANERATKDTTVAACRILNKLIKSTRDVEPYSTRVIGTSNNRYLIDYAIDKGLGDRLYTLDPNSRSNTTNAALRDNGYSFDGTTDSDIFKRVNAERVRAREENIIKSLIRHINNDYFRDAENILRQYPKFLDEQSVIDAINDPENDHNVTARQLRRRLAQRSANKPKELYDL